MDNGDLHSGNLTQPWKKGPFMDDLPIKHGDLFRSYVESPEGI